MAHTVVKSHVWLRVLQIFHDCYWTLLFFSGTRSVLAEYDHLDLWERRYVEQVDIFSGMKTPIDKIPWWRHQMETFPRYWPFVRGIHRSPVNSPHKGQWRRALMFSLICTRINGWVNNGEADDLRRCLAHYDVTVMPMNIDSVITWTNNGGNQKGSWYKWHYNDVIITPWCLNSPPTPLKFNSLYSAMTKK